MDALAAGEFVRPAGSCFAAEFRSRVHSVLVLPENGANGTRRRKFFLLRLLFCFKTVRNTKLSVFMQRQRTEQYPVLRRFDVFTCRTAHGAVSDTRVFLMQLPCRGSVWRGI